MSAAIGGTPVAFQSEVERGRHVYSTFVDVPPQSEIQIELDLSGTLTNPSAYVLDLHAQPVVKPDTVMATATWGSQHTQTKRLVLNSGDERLHFEDVVNAAR